jgi:hypothetical protein
LHVLPLLDYPASAAVVGLPLGMPLQNSHARVHRCRRRTPLPAQPLSASRSPRRRGTPLIRSSPQPQPDT